MPLLDEWTDVGTWLGSLAWLPTVPTRIDPVSQQRPHTTVPDPPPMWGPVNKPRWNQRWSAGGFSFG